MKKLIVMSALLAVSVTGARAEFFIGGSLTTTASSFETAINEFDSDEMGWKAYVGWDFMKFLGAEAGYRDLGNFSEGVANGNIDVDLKVIDVSARAFLPIGRLFNLYAKAGYANISWDGNVNISGIIQDFNQDDWELFYGIGTEFKLGKNWGIRAEWEQYDVSDQLSTLSAGILYRF